MMLDAQGTIKLMTFGIARSSKRPGHDRLPAPTLGSLDYMSPEQVKSEPT